MPFVAHTCSRMWDIFITKCGFINANNLDTAHTIKYLTNITNFGSRQGANLKERLIQDLLNIYTIIEFLFSVCKHAKA